MDDPSAVTFYANGGVMHTGDGVRLYQARVVCKGLEACLKGMQLNRLYTPTRLKQTATGFTKKTYKAGKRGTEQAIADLREWIRACTAAMPVVVEP